MSLPPVPLSPDDDAQRPVQLPRAGSEAGQPYGFTAVAIGLLVMLPLHLTQIMTNFSTLKVGVGVMLFSYALLAIARPRLPLHALATAAAVLGLLYSLPAFPLMHPGMLTLAGVVMLVTELLLATMTGLLLGVLLHVELYPGFVLPFNFFLLFVLTSILTLLR